MRNVGGFGLPPIGGVRFVHGRFLALAVLTVAALVPVPALAQNLDEGKTPQQLFAADCSACHKSPQGLGKNASVGFLRQHYTSSARSASLLAGYLASAGAAPAERQKTRAEEREKRKKTDQAAVNPAAETGTPAAGHRPSRKDARKSRRPEGAPAEPAGTANPTPGPAATSTAAVERAGSPVAVNAAPPASPPAPPPSLTWDEATLAALSAPAPKPQPAFAAPLP